MLTNVESFMSWDCGYSIRDIKLSITIIVTFYEYFLLLLPMTTSSCYFLLLLSIIHNCIIPHRLTIEND